jgi:two-component system nitrate/nitrite response regulator NarL
VPGQSHSGAVPERIAPPPHGGRAIGGVAIPPSWPPERDRTAPAPWYNRLVSAPARTRVIVADDHPLYREGVVRAIKERPDLELVGECDDGRAALDDIKRLEPDVAVLDVKMPGLDGTGVLNAVEREGLATRVVFLSAYLDGAFVYSAVAGGAAGYLSKEADRQEICDAIAAVARGETILAAEAQSGIAREVRLRRQEDRPALTAREREILELTAKGRSAPQIAGELFLSTATVKTHLQHLYEKLGVSDRAAAVAEAMRRGLLE